ncbi:hypothetical protein [Polymorphum gilvum]|uniref:Gamma-glutamylcyclotransferase AIG2-like domain-containing protein n=1 Tax=Polymorphum gilvum (strain LMG 25793 / CGMCC 1.9160 / SL003B-26A1) TaxID=991905 RepID=F2J5B6_POLGS|nr:hypothetical protein [Polymorphum gilvum]ADZ71175.1 hypothetical protein SL003B_2752 [Polymorphum gilvum SL003B-26A1]
MTMSYFGYGSLVNVRTLAPAARAQPGCLSGWVREWRIWGTGELGRGVCALTVAPAAGTTLRGVRIDEPAQGLDALLARERKYDRIDGIGAAFRHDADAAPGPQDMFLFRSRPEHYGWGDDDHPILQSYLDCVLAGFHAFWGEAGIVHFLQTTDGWHVPILKDRDAPVYPRAIALDPALREAIDDLLSDQRVRYLSAG